jgi:hypothetical protein
MHESLNNNLYNCLHEKRWKTAVELGSFALTDPMKKEVSEIGLRMRVINVAIALKFAGKMEAAQKLLDSVDWSASYRDFKLAICVLNDNFDEAVKIMESIGKSGEIIQQHSYHIWPLFYKFRERVDFYSTYEKIYGEPYFAMVPAAAAVKKEVATAVAKRAGERKMVQPKPVQLANEIIIPTARPTRARKRLTNGETKTD